MKESRHSLSARLIAACCTHACTTSSEIGRNKLSPLILNRRASTQRRRDYTATCRYCMVLRRPSPLVRDPTKFDHAVADFAQNLPHTPTAREIGLP